MKLDVHDHAPQVRMTDLSGNVVMLGRPMRRTLLCFLGDAACAFCNVYIQDLIGHYAYLRTLGLDVIVLYNARQSAVWHFLSSRPCPFPIIADQASVAYRRYGVERSLWRKLKGVAADIPTFVRGLRMVGTAGINADPVMPADFLIDERGCVVEAHYGAGPGDHIPFRRIEAFVGGAATRAGFARAARPATKIPLSTYAGSRGLHAFASGHE